MLKLKKIQKVFWGIFLVYAFTFSWHLTFSSVLLLLMGITWITAFWIEGQNTFSNFYKSRNAWILVIPYLIGVLGLTYTRSVDNGVFLLGVAFCMLIQPIIFSSSNWQHLEKKKIWYVLLCFVAGSFIAALYCLIYAGVNYLGGSSLGLDEFYYIHLMKLPLSPGAFGNYMNVSIVILLLYATNELVWVGKREMKYRILAIVLLLFFVCFLFLLQAKGSIVALIIAFGVLFLYKMTKYFSKNIVLGIMALSIFGGALFIQFGGLNLLGSRFTEIPKVINTISKTSETSTSLRLSAIHGSVDIIKRNPLLGVGTGAVKQELEEFYEKEGYVGAKKHKTDSHNQFLRTFAKNGVVGFIALIFMILLPIVIGIKRNDPLLLLVSVTQLVMALTGDILDNQPGVVFHSFVICFLIYVANPKQFIAKGQ